MSSSSLKNRNSEFNDENVFQNMIKMLRRETFDYPLKNLMSNNFKIKKPKNLLKKTKIVDLSSSGVINVVGGFHTSSIIFSTTSGYLKKFNTKRYEIEWSKKINLTTYLSVSQNERNILYGFTSSDIYTVPFSGGNEEVIYKNINDKILVATFLNETDNLYLGGENNFSSLYNVEKKTLYKNLCLRDDKNIIYKSADRNNRIISFSNLIAIGDNYGNTSIWDFSTLKPAFQYGFETYHYVTAIKFHPCGHVLAVSFSDRKVELIDLRSDVCFTTFLTPVPSIPISIEFSLSGRLMFVGCSSGQIIVWDVILENICINMKMFKKAPCSNLVSVENGQKIYATSKLCNKLFSI